MGSKYKSPLIRSRNTTPAVAVDVSQNVETPPPAANNNAMNNEYDGILIYDNAPQPLPSAQHWRGRGRGRGFNSPRFSSPQPRGSPYQWTPPNRFNNSWTPDRNNSDSYASSNEQNSNSPSRPPFNKFTKRNSNNYSSRNNEKSHGDESYFHPSMLEDPWASLLNNSANNFG